MTTTTFIANIGGVLGLCMGFSFVSLIEIIYFTSSPLLTSIAENSDVRTKSKNCMHIKEHCMAGEVIVICLDNLISSSYLIRLVPFSQTLYDTL